MSSFADEDVYRRFEKHNYVLSFSLLIARLMRLAIILPAEVSCKRNKIKTFPNDSAISLCGVVVRRRVEPKVQRSSPTEFFIPSFSFFSVFCVVVFYKYIAK